MSLTPKSVIALGSSSAITPNIPLLVDTNGVLFVSPPTFIVAGVEKTAGFIETNTDAQLATLFGAVGASFNYGFNGATWDRIVTDDSTADVQPSVTGNLKTIALQYVLDPVTATYFQVFSASIVTDAIDPTIFTPLPFNLSALSAFNGATFDRVRVANVFNSVLATAAGLTAVWTPAAGKSFRLMGYTISVAGTLAATAVELIQLVDNAIATKVIARHQATVTITTPTGDTQIGAELNNGYLSVAPDNVLRVNLSAAMATGGVAINTWGTEE